MFKNHILLILALVSLMISFQSVVTFKRLSYDYQQKLSSSYAMIMIAKSKLDYDEVKDQVPAVKEIVLISKEEVIRSIKDELTKENIVELSEELPLFYRIHLKTLPTKYELYTIEEKLKKITQLIKIEAFTGAQNKISALIEIVENILIVFSALFLFISSLLITKQISVWRYMHQNRMQIMAILGAKMWFRSKNLYKMAFIDSIISTFLIASLFSYVAHSEAIIKKLDSLGLVPLRYFYFNDTLILLMISLAISVSGVMYVVIKSEKELQ